MEGEIGSNHHLRKLLDEFLASQAIEDNLTPYALNHSYLEQIEATMDQAHNPAERTQHLAIAITEGCLLDKAAEAVTSYHQIKELRGEDHTIYWPLDQKKQVGQILVKALVTQGFFVDAYTIALDLERLDPQIGYLAKCTLLAYGYNGPDNCLADLADTLQPFANIVQPYFLALADSGVDVTNIDLPQSMLLRKVVWQESSLRRQQFLRNLTVRYALSNPLVATTLLGNITQHTVRAQTLLDIARLTQDTNDSTIALQRIVAEVESLIMATSSCMGECGTPHPNAHIEARQLAIGLVPFYTRLGDIDAARATLEANDTTPHFPLGKLQAYTALYGATGNQQDRTAALQLLPHATPPIHNLIRHIAQADMLYNATVPSLTTDTEALPQIAWEIQACFADQDELTPTVSARRRLQRSQAFSSLAVLLAEQQAPAAAQQMLDRIENPADKVWALARIKQLRS